LLKGFWGKSSFIALMELCVSNEVQRLQTAFCFKSTPTQTSKPLLDFLGLPQRQGPKKNGKTELETHRRICVDHCIINYFCITTPYSITKND
jgi:hypothetical protein